MEKVVLVGMVLMVLVVLLAPSKSITHDKTPCDILFEQRQDQTLNDRNPKSIAMTDSMLIKCGCFR